MNNSEIKKKLKKENPYNNVILECEDKTKAAFLVYPEEPGYYGARNIVVDKITGEQRVFPAMADDETLLNW